MQESAHGDFQKKILLPPIICKKFTLLKFNIQDICRKKNSKQSYSLNTKKIRKGRRQIRKLACYHDNQGKTVGNP